MTCKECLGSLPDLLTGNLSAAEARAVEEHLAACRSCASEGAELRRTWEALGAWPDGAPGAVARPRFYAMLERAKARESARPAPVLGRGFLGWPSWRPAFQVALAALLVAVGVWIGRGTHPTGGGAGDVRVLAAEVEDMRTVLSTALLNQFSPVDRLMVVQAMSSGSRLEEPALRALVRTVESDPSPNVRLAAVDALSRFLDRAEVREGMLGAMEKQTYPMVQISLIDALATARDERSRGALRALAENADVDPAVREHARAKVEEPL
jgi:HEAT repeat protein